MLGDLAGTIGCKTSSHACVKEKKIKCRNWRFIVASILLCGMLSAEAAAEEKKVTVPASELPAVIGKAIKRALPKGKVVRIQKEVEGEDPGQYDVAMRSGGKEYEVEISPEGEVIEVKEVGAESGIPGGEPLFTKPKSSGKARYSISSYLL